MRKLNKIGAKADVLPFCERGNFLPVSHELSYSIKDILHGQVPSDITGTFLKNGPNPQFPNETQSYNWVQGDGMIHGFSIQDGQLKYCNRYTQTDRYNLEKEVGGQARVQLAELKGKGVFLILTQKL